MKKIVSLILTLALLVTMCSVTTFAFAAEGDANVFVTGVKLKTSAATRLTGEESTIVLEATVEPSTATEKGITYSVKDGKTGVTVDTDGNITVSADAAAGEYIIIATSVGNKEDGTKATAEFKLTLRDVFTMDAAANEKLMTELKKDAAFADLKWEMSSFKLPQEWLKDSGLVKSIFGSAMNYLVDGDEGYDKDAKYDQIYVEYCRPSESSQGKDTWDHSTKITEGVSISTSGWWKFRLVVKDGTDTSKVLCKSDAFVRYAEDTTHPVVELSSDMVKKHEEGLTSGVTYTVSTSLSYPDDSNSSSKTVTYVIQKKVNNDWVTIYDSVKREVTKGYESYVSTSGVITPADEDIRADKTAVYRVVYSVVDSYGFHGVADSESTVEHNPKLELFVKAPESKGGKASAVLIWKIILYVIAGLSAVGIVVLLCIKPKQKTETPRAEAKPADKDDQADNTQK